MPTVKSKHESQGKVQSRKRLATIKNIKKIIRKLSAESLAEFHKRVISLRQQESKLVSKCPASPRKML